MARKAKPPPDFIRELLEPFVREEGVREIARRINVDPSTVSRFINGEFKHGIPTHTASRIIDALGLSVAVMQKPPTTNGRSRRRSPRVGTTRCV